MKKYFAILLVLLALTVTAYAQTGAMSGHHQSGTQMSGQEQQAQCPGIQKIPGQVMSECERQKCPVADTSQKQGAVKLCSCSNCGKDAQTSGGK